MQGTAQRLRIDAARGGTEVSGSGAAAATYHPDAFTGQIPASTGIATLMRNYRTGLFTDDVIPAPLNEALLGISRGPSATLRPWIELVEIITSHPATAAGPATWRPDPYQSWTRYAPASRR